MEKNHLRIPPGNVAATGTTTRSAVSSTKKAQSQLRSEARGAPGVVFDPARWGGLEE